MPAPLVYVGIDVHQATHRAALLSAAALEGGRWTEHADLAMRNNRASFDALLAAIAEHTPDPARVAIAVDFTGGHYSAPLVHLLATAGFTVEHIQPQALSAIRQKLLGQENKTDPTDAAAMAHVLYLHRAHGVRLRVSPVRTDLTSAAAVMRAYLAQIADVKRGRTAALNRLHQYWTATFPEGEQRAFATLVTAAAGGAGPCTPAELLQSAPPPRVRAATWAVLQELALTTVGVPATPYRELIARSAAAVRLADVHAKELSQGLAAVVAGHPHGPLYCTVPGVAANTAAVVISGTEDAARYPTPQAFRRALGVYSTLKTSGAGGVAAKMGHGGSRPARAALFRSALVACTHPTAQPRQHPLRAWYDRRVAGGMPKKRALSAVSGKLAEHLWAIGRSGQPWENRI